MEAVEEAVAPPPSGQITKNPSPIAKGKRTKRYRTHSPIPFTTRPPSIAAPTNHRPDSSSSSEDDSTTTEEEDTARCLILLAQGHFPPNNRSTMDHKHRHFLEQKKFFQNNATTSKAAGGSCMYTCKTCNRDFSSFQALGGHRASHKKPKNEKRSAMFSDEEDFSSPSSISSFRINRMPSNTLSLQLSNISNTNTIPKPSAPSPRIHECSYCGAEFNSGQALGGHMRRHRGGPIRPRVNVASAAASPRNVLSLDLNLPAPEDENQRFGLSGPIQQKSPEEMNEVGEHIVLSTTTTAPALVDCHY